MLKKLLTYNIDDLPLDAPETTEKRKQIILHKKVLKQIYLEWYQIIMQEVPLDGGRVLEIGSGGGFIQEIYPNVITSDILPLKGCDYIFDASKKWPFEKDSLGAVVMTNVLHHIPDVTTFFNELDKTLKKGGVISLIEPWNTPWARWIYQNLHHEPFEVDRTEWSFPSKGPLSDANGALPWIIFERDQEKLKSLFPNWKIESVQKIMPIRYLLSGGVSLKSPIPTPIFPLLKSIEKNVLLKMNMGMFAHILVRKTL